MFTDLPLNGIKVNQRASDIIESSNRAIIWKNFKSFPVTKITIVRHSRTRKSHFQYLPVFFISYYNELRLSKFFLIPIGIIISILIIIAKDTIDIILDIICTFESKFSEYMFIKLGRINAEDYPKKKESENSHYNFFFSHSFNFTSLKNMISQVKLTFEIFMLD